MERVVICAGAFPPSIRAGGPVASLARVVDTVRAHLDLVVLTRDRDLGASTPFDGLHNMWTKRASARVWHGHSWRTRDLVQIYRQLSAPGLTILYLNSLFQRAHSVLPILLVATGMCRPKILLIATRGELGSSALQQGSRLKRAYLALVRRALRSQPVIWHASSELEAGQIASHFPNTSVVLVPEQVSPAKQLVGIDAVVRQTGDSLRLGYVSRIAAIKNPLSLVRGAVIAARRTGRQIVVDLYGPAEDPELLRACLDIAEIGDAPVSVAYHGVLPQDRVQETFRNFDAFVLPTAGENFCHAIAEALSVGCPVACPDTTPWTDVLLDGGGWVLAGTDPAAVADGIERLSAELDTASTREVGAAVQLAFRDWYEASGSRNVIDEVLRLIVDRPGPDHPS